MKSNFKRSQSKESKTEKRYERREEDGTRLRGFSSTPKSSEIIQIVKLMVEDDYRNSLRDYGEDSILIILEQMLLPKYVKRFEPASPQVKNAVKKCVVSFIAKMAMGDEENVSKLSQMLNIENIQEKSDEELEDELKKLEAIKKGMALKNKTGIDGLIATYKQEIKRRYIEINGPDEDEVVQAVEEAPEATEAIVKETAEPLKSVSIGEPEVSEDATALQEDEPEQIEDEKIFSVNVTPRTPVKGHMTVLRKMEEVSKKFTLEEKAEEIEYFEMARDFTSGFEFLAEDEISYYSKVGGSNPSKFDSFDRYSRFQELRYRVNKRMSAMKISEIEAIAVELSDKCSLLGPADKKILADRRDVINREIARNVREGR